MAHIEDDPSEVSKQEHTVHELIGDMNDYIAILEKSFDQVDLEASYNGEDLIQLTINTSKLDKANSKTQIEHILLAIDEIDDHYEIYNDRDNYRVFLTGDNIHKKSSISNKEK